mgnify:CR=1 FL=1
MTRALNTNLGANVVALFTVDDDNLTPKEFKNGWTSGAGFTLTNVTVTNALAWKSVAAPMLVHSGASFLSITDSTAVASTSPMTFFAVVKNGSQALDGQIAVSAATATGADNISNTPLMRFGSSTLIPVMAGPETGATIAIATDGTPLAASGESYSFFLCDQTTTNADNVSYLVREANSTASSFAVAAGSHGNVNLAGDFIRRIGSVDWNGNFVMYGWLNIAVTQAQAEAIHADPFGAFFQAGDVTSPVLSSPTGAATGKTTANVGATTDEGSGTLYAVVTTSGTQPSVAQIKAGQSDTGAAAAWSGSQAISSAGTKTLGATGLSPSPVYYAHMVHTDAAANDSNRASSAAFDCAGHAGSDVSVAGWVGTPGSPLYACIDDVVASDADYVTSPSITGTPSPAIFSLTNAPWLAGPHSVPVRAMCSSGTANIRVRLYDNAGTEVGASSLQPVTDVLATYAVAVVAAADAYRIGVEFTA